MPSLRRSGWRRAPRGVPTGSRSRARSSPRSAQLAKDGPLLLAIDDVQWLDPASARVLSFAVRRVGEEPIGVLDDA